MRQTFKTYFVPHAENDYHPHILHTKRALMYSALFVVVKVIIMGAVVLFPSTVFVLPDVLAKQQAEIIYRTNALRASKGLDPLSTDVLLNSSAQHKAANMGLYSYFSHTGPDGRSLAHYLADVGYQYTAAGENLAMGYTDVSELMNAWIQSPTHYANLIDPEFREFGIGLQSGEYDAFPTVYIAQHFGAPVMIEEAEVPPPEPQKEEASAVLEPETQDTPTEEEMTAETLDEPVAPEQDDHMPEALETSTIPAEPTTDVVSVSETLGDHIDTSDEPVSPVDTAIEESVIPVLVEQETTQNTDAVETPEPETSIALYNREQSMVSWKEYDGGVAIVANVRTSHEVTAVTLEIHHQVVPLSDKRFVGEEQVFSGEIYLPIDKEELFAVVIPPSITLSTTDGRTIQDTVAWQNPMILSPTPIDKYVAARKYLPFMKPLVQASQAVYGFFLGLFAIALIIMIVVEVRKQHWHIIAQTAAMLCLLVVLILA